MAKHNIEDTAKIMNLSEYYVRALITRKGVLASTMEPIVPESLVTRHMVEDEEIARYLSSTTRKSHRKDGRNKYVAYMTVVENVEVQKVLRANGLGEVADTIRTWNQLKPAATGQPTKPKRKPRKGKNAPVPSV